MLDDPSAIELLPKLQRKIQILLAEDCPDTQALITYLLEKIGAEVTVVEDGERCVERAMCELSKGKPFDVILVDVRMPRMDGPTAVRNLRQRGYDAPIVAITSEPSLSGRAESSYVGCNEFLAKNSLAETIIPALKNILKIDC